MTDTFITIILTDKQKEIIQKEAEKKEQSLSNFSLNKILEGLTNN